MDRTNDTGKLKRTFDACSNLHEPKMMSPQEKNEMYRKMSIRIATLQELYMEKLEILQRANRMSRDFQSVMDECLVRSRQHLFAPPAAEQDIESEPVYDATPQKKPRREVYNLSPAPAPSRARRGEDPYSSSERMADEPAGRGHDNGNTSSTSTKQARNGRQKERDRGREREQPSTSRTTVAATAAAQAQAESAKSLASYYGAYDDADDPANYPDEPGQMDVDDFDPEADGDEVYCHCRRGASFGDMVGCDGEGCKFEWFHLRCVGLKVPPGEGEKWYCRDCAELLEIHRDAQADQKAKRSSRRVH
ncbi:hypothetical protein RI367_003484 [Sorochytrium milnesiophthora]